MISGLGQSSSATSRCTRSTTRLGLGGLALAIAKYFSVGVVLRPFPYFTVAGATYYLGGLDNFILDVIDRYG